MGYPAPFPLLGPSGVACLAAVMLIGSVGVFTNRLRRLALVCLFGSALYVQMADIHSAYTLNKLFVVVYFILLITPGYYRDSVSGKLMVAAVGLRIIQATLILQYFSAGVSKAFVGDWLTHGDVLYTQVQGIFRTETAAWMLRTLPIWAWTVMQWVALIFELEAPVLFTLRKMRPVAFVLGMGMHLMIALTMNHLIQFACVMWSFYALFVTSDEWRRIGDFAGFRRLYPR